VSNTLASPKHHEGFFMTIDPKTESIFLLSDANDHSYGKSVSRQAWWRRALKGVKGPSGEMIRLATILIGRERYTSQAAIDAFIAAQNAETAGNSIAESSPMQRQRQSEAAGRELAEMGV
jgi:hypothetical protein